MIEKRKRIPQMKPRVGEEKWRELKCKEDETAQGATLVNTS